MRKTVIKVDNVRYVFANGEGTQALIDAIYLFMKLRKVDSTCKTSVDLCDIATTYSAITIMEIDINEAKPEAAEE